MATGPMSSPAARFIAASIGINAAIATASAGLLQGLQEHDEDERPACKREWQYKADLKSPGETLDLVGVKESKGKQTFERSPEVQRQRHKSFDHEANGTEMAELHEKNSTKSEMFFRGRRTNQTRLEAAAQRGDVRSVDSTANSNFLARHPLQSRQRQPIRPRMDKACSNEW